MNSKPATGKKSPAKRDKKPVSANSSDTRPVEETLKLYTDMLMIRRFEEKAGQLYGMGLIGGFCHLYIGQEAVVVGITAASDPVDTIITSYRDHGHMLACGMDPKGVMAELTGRSSGYSKGKGGSMHMFSREKNFYGGHGIVGAQVALGTGLAFSHQYQGDGGVAHIYFGDGAANQGQVYESFNMAALWKLPALYIIENNKYGMGTPIHRASATTEFYRRGEAHDIPGMKVNGMDVHAVREAAAEALAHCRSGKGPFILDMETYRYRGHSMSDPAKYRSREEVDKVRSESDPIDRLRTQITHQGIADEERLKAIDKDIKTMITDATTFAQESPQPDECELWTDILMTP